MNDGIPGRAVPCEIACNAADAFFLFGDASSCGGAFSERVIVVVVVVVMVIEMQTTYEGLSTDETMLSLGDEIECSRLK